MTSYIEELRKTEGRWRELSRAKMVQHGRKLPSPHGPILAIGSGCSFAVAQLAATALEQLTGAITCARTPYFVSRSKAKPQLALLISAHGEHKDALETFCWLRARGIQTVVVTTNPESSLVELANRASKLATVLHPDTVIDEGGFVPVESTLSLALLLRRLPFLRVRSEPRCIEMFSQARLAHARSIKSVLHNPAQYHVLCSVWGRAACQDFETRVLESGFPAISVSDPLNFVHGRYMPFVRNTVHQVAISFSVYGESVDFSAIERLRKKLALNSICAPYPRYWGAMYCMIRSMLLMEAVASFQGIDPANPRNPQWGARLYTRTGGRT